MLRKANVRCVPLKHSGRECDLSHMGSIDGVLPFATWSRVELIWQSLVQAREHVMTDHVSDEQSRMPTPFEHPLAIAIRSGLRFIANFRHYHDRTGARERRHVREVATEQALSESSPPGA